MTTRSRDTVANRFREKRIGRLLDHIDRFATPGAPVRLLDIGGTIAFWEAMRHLWGDRDLRITIVNLGSETRDEGVYALREGDARDLHEFADRSFDIVHSNSVIEHVGMWKDMKRMAAECRRLSDRCFIQTPSWWFPIEPHYRMPFMHYLPQHVRARIMTRRAVGFYRRAPSYDHAMGVVQENQLLTGRQMAELFPEATIVSERWMGLSKSLIAIR